MTKISIHHDENSMEFFIKGLLSLDNKGEYTRSTIDSRLHILFVGRKENVQKNIYEWLSLPKRKQSFGG